jgi:Ni,Fe-hydrogenase III large subunit
MSARLPVPPAPRDASAHRALLRELARLANLLAQLSHAVQAGALAGDPLHVLAVLERLEAMDQRLRGLAEADRLGLLATA